MKSKLSLCLAIILVLMLITLPIAHGDDWYGEHGKYYRVYDAENNQLLFETAREVSRGDQYLSGDNKMYHVVRVNTRNHLAYAEFVKEVQLPKVNKEALQKVQLALKEGGLAALILAQEEGENGEEEQDRRVGIYATHSAESYTPTDGSESIEGGGGILKVAETLKNSFDNYGVEGVFDNTSHEPHDAGAYKRSRRTAVQLMRDQGIGTLIDVHRDATPAEAYLTEIDGEPASKVRLVIGRRNQNFKANEELAMQVKAVADESRPGLIKDIFYAKGDYNQDLTPRAMLVEMGTYQHTRQRAEKAAGYLAEVVTTALFGGIIEEEAADEEGAAPTPQETGGVEESNTGSGVGIIGLIAVIAIGGFAFLFISSGGNEWKSKLSNFKQEFANFLGRRKRK
ncbi:stage II sporulation P family protein [Clostridium aceticum]|uniref:Stage II sporulation P family protein n=1 Tax=Clostridium aceticum TaxID=84022 RepID=A0A0G3WB90_9CLOT|nr:stage II sporulation protein P [Clostridium aceticum]AKL95608.1 stage II sporulation P family protein [Clostridium aceticum]